MSDQNPRQHFDFFRDAAAEITGGYLAGLQDPKPISDGEVTTQRIAELRRRVDGHGRRINWMWLSIGGLILLQSINLGLLIGVMWR